jgi:hypothetical protein
MKPEKVLYTGTATPDIVRVDQDYFDHLPRQDALNVHGERVE